MSAADMEQHTAKQRTDADAELAIVAATEAASAALRAGMRAPLFILEDSKGQRVALEELLRHGPVVLHFFRGAWCAFGERSVAEFASTYDDVIALGATMLAIAPPGKLSTSPPLFPMVELRDVDMKVARTYGLAFDLPAALRSRYEQLGYSPPSTKQPDAWLVPLPATYLVDRDGIVALAYIDVDYRKRFEPASLLTALKALNARHASAHRQASLLR